MAVHGTRRRDSVSWDHSGLLKLLAGLARDRTGLPVLRCYWYENADGGRTAEHDALAEMPGLKLRLVNTRPGRREGIESQLRRDVVTLAHSGAISDAFIASADEHLAEIVAEVQDLGLRVVVLHIASDGGWTIPQPLRQECDDIVEISAVHLRPFVDLIRGAEPAAEEQYARGGYGSRSRADTDDSMASAADSGVPSQALPASGGQYQAARGPENDPARPYVKSGSAAYDPGAGGGRSSVPEQALMAVRNPQPDGGPGEFGASEFPGLAQEAAAQLNGSGHAASPHADGRSQVEERPYGAYGTGARQQTGSGQRTASSRSTAQHASPGHAQSAGFDQGRGQQSPLDQGQPATSAPAQEVRHGQAQDIAEDVSQHYGQHSGGQHAGHGRARQHEAQGRAAQHPAHAALDALESGAYDRSGSYQDSAYQDGGYQDGGYQRAGQHNGGHQSGDLLNGGFQGAGFQPGPAQPGPAQAGPAQPGAAQAGPVPDGAAQAGPAKGGPGQSPNVHGLSGLSFPTGPGGSAQNGNGAAPGGGHQGGYPNGAGQNGAGVQGAPGYQNGAPHNAPGQYGSFSGYQPGGSNNGSQVDPGLVGDGTGNPAGNGAPPGGNGVGTGRPNLNQAQFDAVPVAGQPSPYGPMDGGYHSGQPGDGQRSQHRGAGQPGPGAHAGDGYESARDAYAQASEAYGSARDAYGAARDGYGPVQRATPSFQPHAAHQAPPNHVPPNHAEPQLLPQPGQPAGPLPAVRPAQPVAISLTEAVKAAHSEGFTFGQSIGRDAPGLWLEAVLARKPRMPSDLEARLLQGSGLPIDSLLHDEVRHSLRRGFWEALESARR
ncbi:MAG: NYN domain-containing protein [Nocardiopsaceae bacterium]|nr:NYN domain-containing protein [Nocardiopsaceae bacterium]